MVCHCRRAGSAGYDELRDEMESELEIKDIPAFQVKSGELFTMLMNGQAITIEEKAVEN